ncbi:hypothetical protein D1871_17065 [Nakamurella silvestris]|nr:hypothetical protein D1871_17065 [Nakamurella silvestris]
MKLTAAVAAVVIAATLPASAQALPVPVATAGAAAAAITPAATSTTVADPAESVMDSLADYWSAVFPAQFGQSFVRLSSGTAGLDSGVGGNGSMCVTEASQIMGNAYYCPQADGIVYDTGVLVPVLEHDYGPGAVAASLAHEYGHAIAARVGPTVTDRAQDPKKYPALFVELQADCYSGTFLKAATEQRAGGTTLDPDRLATAVSPLLDFRDAVGVDPAGNTAHGLGTDRLQALVHGWLGSPAECHDMTLKSLRITLGTRGVRTDGSLPRFADDTALRQATRKSLTAFLATETGAAAVRADDVRFTAEQRATATPIGQFALASAGVHAAMTRAFGPGPSAACWTGAWVGAVFPTRGGDRLGSWAGDPDEALDMFRTTEPDTATLLAYTAGFAEGSAACR